MAKSKTMNVVAHIIKADKKEVPIEKASQQVEGQSGYASSEWLEPPLPMAGFEAFVANSSILPQCIRAYKSNIAGFGIGVKYKDDVEESEEMAAEYQRAEDIINLLNMDTDTKEVFENIIEARETFGISYLEVIRNLDGEVNTIEFIKLTDSIRKTAPLSPYVEVEYRVRDRIEKRDRKFCKYRQKIGNNTVYFKEIGDPRIMDKRDGEYKDELVAEYRAAEIMEFAIGANPYGEVRWVGQILGISGSREAEELNKRYFEEGRHTPLLIMIRGGTLTQASYDKLKEYMNGIKGKDGQHAFMILEVESAESTTMLDQDNQPDIQAVPLAQILQKDELFQEYLDNNRRRVQSSFLLPDLYVGYTTDFNRATAQTAMEVTEEQVFQPERTSIMWAINNKLLASHNFNNVEAYFKSPNITNPEDLSKILTICERAGGIPPNKAKEIAYSALGEVSESYPDNWGDFPIAYWRSMVGVSGDIVGQGVPDTAIEELATQIEKAASDGNADIVTVMKAVKSLLVELNEVA